MQGQTQLDLPEQSPGIDLSIVIVSYNTRQLTIECVQSVIEHHGGLNVEVIVVDNCSSDGSSEALRSAFPEIHVIDSPANGGFAFGNNIGFEQASGRYILLLNPDTRMYEGGLETSLRHMDAHQEVGLLGPRIYNSSGKLDKSMIRFLSLKHFFFLIFLPAAKMQHLKSFGDMRYASKSYNEINQVDAMTGCFLLVRREVLATVGGLDQRFFMYSEETEWCHRIKRAGWVIQYNPNIEILHHGAASTEQMSEWKAVEMTKGHILFLRLTRGSLVAWIGTLFMLFRDLLRAIYFGPISATRGCRLPENAKPWWARLKYLFEAIIKQPIGQVIKRPPPSEIT